MSTPVMAFTQYLKWMLMGFWLLWVTTLLVSRIFIFHAAYTTHVAKVSDENWLLEQCKTPEFYSNIRQHTDLCEAVYTNSRSSPFLVAMNAMAVNTYACGTKSCVDVFQGIFVRMGWQTIGVAIIMLLFVPNLAVALYQTVCGRFISIEESAFLKHTERHGVPYFQDLQTYTDIDASNSALRKRV
jgi:hypothetical protein